MSREKDRLLEFAQKVITKRLKRSELLRSSSVILNGLIYDNRIMLNINNDLSFNISFNPYQNSINDLNSLPIISAVNIFVEICNAR